jgi:uncharacterized protein with HEPN domain
MRRDGGSDPLDDRIRCIHMLAAAKQAQGFITGRQLADLDGDHMLRRALKDCIQEIGEAAAKMTDPGRARVPGLPWGKLVGMRHILVHAYYDIDHSTIWKVAVVDLPPLIAAVETALARWPAAPTE